MQRRLSAALALTALLAGCMGAKLTPQELQANGTREFQAPPDKVFKAALDALQAQDYEIAVSDQEKGTIKTKRKFLAAIGRNAAVAITRQYTLKVAAKGDGMTSVEAKPRVFQGEEDLSEQGVWVLEGSTGERALWARLFKEIQEGL